MKILISGYYGFGNCGDEAVLQAIVQGLKGHDLTVLSAAPGLTSQLYKVSSVNRYLCPFIIKRMLMTDLFLSGGGTLFQNKTSNRSFYYYLALVFIAKLFRKKVMIFAQGFGPLNGWLNKKLIKFVFNRVDAITLRDNDSYEKLKALGIDPDRMKVTADPALLLDIPSISEGEKLLSLEGIKKKGKPLLGIALRDVPKLDIDPLIDTIDWLAEKYNYIPIFVLFQSPQDMHGSAKVIDGIKGENHLIFRICKPNEMLSLFSQFDLVIGMRLHSLIFALINTVPMLGLSYDPKVGSFMKEIEQPYVDINRPEAMKEELERIIKNKESIKQKLAIKKKELQEKAKLNFEGIK